MVMLFDLQGRSQLHQSGPATLATPPTASTSKTTDANWSESYDGTIGQQVAGASCWLLFFATLPETAWELHTPGKSSMVAALVDVTCMAAGECDTEVSAGVLLWRGTSPACRAELVSKSHKFKNFSRKPQVVDMGTTECKAVEYIMANQPGKPSILRCTVWHVMYAMVLLLVSLLFVVRTRNRVPKGRSVSPDTAERTLGYLPIYGGGRDLLGSFSKLCWAIFPIRLGKKGQVPAKGQLPEAGRGQEEFHPSVRNVCSSESYMHNEHSHDLGDVPNPNNTEGVRGRDSMVKNHAPFSRISPSPAVGGEDSIPYTNMAMPSLNAFDIQHCNPLNTKGVRGRDNMVKNHALISRISPCPAAGGEDSISYTNMTMTDLTASYAQICHAPITKGDKWGTVTMANSHYNSLPNSETDGGGDHEQGADAQQYTC